MSWSSAQTLCNSSAMLHSMLRVHDCNMEEGISCCSKLHAQLLTNINGWKLSGKTQLSH